MAQSEAEAAAQPERPTFGIPLVLNMYENLPFWYEFFRQLGCNVIVDKIMRGDKDG